MNYKKGYKRTLNKYLISFDVYYLSKYKQTYFLNDFKTLKSLIYKTQSIIKTHKQQNKTTVIKIYKHFRTMQRQEYINLFKYKNENLKIDEQYKFKCEYNHHFKENSKFNECFKCNNIRFCKALKYITDRKEQLKNEQQENL